MAAEGPRPRRGQRRLGEALRDLWRRITQDTGRGTASSGFPRECQRVFGRGFTSLPDVVFDNRRITYDNPNPSTDTIESKTRNTIGSRFPPASRRARVVNILSPLAIEELIGKMLADALVMPVKIGWRSHRPEDEVRSWMFSREDVQFKLSPRTRAYWEVQQYLRPTKVQRVTRNNTTGVHNGGAALLADDNDPILDDEGQPKLDAKGRPMLRKKGTTIEQNVNVGHLFWRATHRHADGSYRLLPTFGEVSHQAEGYHKGNAWTWIRREGGVETARVVRPEAQRGFQIQILNLESRAWNELRKQCHAFGYAVRWGSGPRRGEFYTQGESPTLSDGTEDTSMCPHAKFGVPCFMPLPPAGEAQPQPGTVATPTSERARPGTFASPEAGILYDVPGLTPILPEPLAPAPAGPPSVGPAGPPSVGPPPSQEAVSDPPPEYPAEEGMMPEIEGDVEPQGEDDEVERWLKKRPRGGE